MKEVMQLAKQTLETPRETSGIRESTVLSGTDETNRISVLH